MNITSKIKKYISLISIGTLLAIVTPVAYLLGLAYYQGYLSVFGVEPDIFPLQTQYVYVNAYHVVARLLEGIWEIIRQLLNNSVRGIYFYAISILTILIIISIDWYSKNKDSDTVKKFVSEIISIYRKYIDNYITRASLLFLMANIICYFLLFIGLAVTLFWWFPGIIAYPEGQKRAFSAILAFQKDGCKIDQKTKLNICTTIYSKKENGIVKVLHEGLLIAISEKEIALFEKDGTHIFARKDDYILQRKIH